MNKIYWEDRPELQIEKNDDGYYLDIDGKVVSFFGDTDLLPKNVSLQYTPEMVEEIIKSRDDVIYFAENYFKAMTPRGFDFLELHDFQKEILKSWETNYKNILKLPRQMGKCSSFDTKLFLNNTVTNEKSTQTFEELFNEAKVQASSDVSESQKIE